MPQSMRQPATGTQRFLPLRKAMDDLPPLICAGCRACCVGDKIAIMPERGDDHRKWKTDRQADGTRTLRRGADGNCIYLGPDGCTIHGRQPYMCRAYDCRKHYLAVLAKDGEAGVSARIEAGLKGIEEGRARVLEDISFDP